MISVCVDTNVLLDYLLERPGKFDHSREVLTLGSSGAVKIYTSASSLLTCLYFLQRYKFPPGEIVAALSGLVGFISIINSSNESFISGLNAGFSDLEDGVQYFTALGNKSIQFFVTSNLKDYKNALPQLQVLSPQQFVVAYGHQ